MGARRVHLERKLVHGVDPAEVVDDEEEERRSLGGGAVEFTSLVDLCLVLSGLRHLCVPVAQNELLGSQSCSTALSLHVFPTTIICS